MKVRKWVVLLIVLAGLTVMGFAQEQMNGSTYIPEFADEPVLLNADNTVTTLEKQVAKARAKPGLLSSKIFYDVTGGNSPVVLQRADENNFIVKLGNPDQAPDTQYTFGQWIANKNARSLVIGSSNLGGTKAGNTAVPFTYKKIGDAIYQLTVKGLAVGHWGISTKSATFLFDIQ
jgi:hypothetical protein